MKFSKEQWDMVKASARFLAMPPTEYVRFCVAKVNKIVVAAIVAELHKSTIETALEQIGEPQPTPSQPMRSSAAMRRGPPPSSAKKKLSHNPFAGLTLPTPEEENEQ